ncbi:cysteine dioxygenase [Mesorhizobium sp. YR577]|uniref:cysteine dioxygenase family protein n=1 Tax=Mesorhizobium sp. YR577 TaxID=1884373 RepID=UPI0008E22414|nr:cysteine dioxygenase [Mesorhizobium sp. YR577]SFU22676.1 Predicted metal-dependent enzyme of the double-stranded beta helix superfamily [Mesorhizobium sp. YR577]
MSIRLFRDFVCELTNLADQGSGEAEMLGAARPMLSDLLARDTWLPDEFARPNENFYQQYLLHCDLKQRFSIVSFVWGPGQETPIHDHTVWGLLGVLRGSEVSQRYEMNEGELHETGGLEILEAGAIDAVSPTIGDIHRVRNGRPNKPSVSIHLYGGNIGAISRHAFKGDGTVKDFTSGYSLETVPNLWTR